MKRVGILGGAFNPVHNTHLMLALAAYEQLSLDKVILMPLHKPPHKSDNELVSDEHRLNMLKIAVEEYPMLEVSDFEIKKEGLSYTSETLTLLTKENKDIKYYFIIGGDSLLKFDTWHEPETILRHAAIACTGRANKDEAVIKARIKELNEKYTTKDFTPEFIYLPIPLSDMSSTQLRMDIACNYAINGLISGNVIDYIYDNELYLDGQIEAITDDLCSILNPHRFKHVMGVARTAYILAKCHGCDQKKAYLAGLLHDCAKHLSDEELIEECEELSLEITPIERKLASSLLHSKVGAYIASDKYKVYDQDIRNAVFYHTTGRPEMSLLEQIIFVADFIEPGREMKAKIPLDHIRALARIDLDQATVAILESTTDYLLSTSGKDEIAPQTFETLEYYRRLIK